jgi:hypothetical protein
MVESINQMAVNLHAAIGEAPDEDSAKQLTEIIGMAEQLRGDIDKAMTDVGEGTDRLPAPDNE